MVGPVGHRAARPGLPGRQLGGDRRRGRRTSSSPTRRCQRAVRRDRSSAPAPGDRLHRARREEPRPDGRHQMPQLGETVTEGTITKWFKQVGDQVAEDEVLFEVSTDKVDSEVPSPVAGYAHRDPGARGRHRRRRHRAGRDRRRPAGRRRSGGPGRAGGRRREPRRRPDAPSAEAPRRAGAARGEPAAERRRPRRPRRARSRRRRPSAAAPAPARRPAPAPAPSGGDGDGNGRCCRRWCAG